MAAASASTPEHNTKAGGTDRPHSSPKLHRRRLLNHLHIQVPVPASSGWSGRPSGPASAPCGSDAHASAPAHHHQDRPASPSLLRSPTAWIRSKGHGFGSGKHTPRRPAGNLHYDARSYAQNFDEGGREEEDALKQHRYSSLGLLASPRQVSPSPSNLQGISGGSISNGEEPARERLRVME